MISVRPLRFRTQPSRLPCSRSAAALCSISLIAALMTFLLPRPAAAQWTANGVAVAPSDSAQITPRIVPDRAGGAIIAWEDGRGGPFLAYAQRLASDGSVAPGWPAFGQLLPSRGPSQSNLVAIADGAGGAYIASDDSSYVGVVMVHHLGQDGLPAPGWSSETVALQQAPYGQPGGTQGSFLPALVADGANGVFVARTYRDRLHQSIALTRLSASAVFDPGWDSGAYAGGAGWDFPSVLCPDGQDGVFVAFQENVIPPRIRIDRFTGLANKVFAGNAVSTAALGQFAPGLVSDGNGGAIVVWEDRRNDLFDQVFAQHLSSDGSLAAEWPATGVAVCTRPTAPGMPSAFVFPGPLSSIEADGRGGAYVAWTDYRDSTGTGDGDIYAQHILGAETLASGWPVDGLAICTAPGDQRLPVVAVDGMGGLLLAWQDARNGGCDIYAQRVGPTGVLAPLWPGGGRAVCTADGDQTTPQVVSDGAAGAIIAWVDGRGSQTQIYAARVTFDAIVPILASLVSADAIEGAVRLEWFAGSAIAAAITIERSAAGTGWLPLASVSAEPNGRIIYEDRDVAPGQRYGYRLTLGSTQHMGETWVTTPVVTDFALEPPHPNPSNGSASLMFALPDAAGARIEIVDVAGRSVFARDVGALGAGRHVLALGGQAALAPGVYLVRLTRRERSLTTRMLVAR